MRSPGGRDMPRLRRAVYCRSRFHAVRRLPPDVHMASGLPGLSTTELDVESRVAGNQHVASHRLVARVPERHSYVAVMEPANLEASAAVGLCQPPPTRDLEEHLGAGKGNRPCRGRSGDDARERAGPRLGYRHVRDVWHEAAAAAVEIQDRAWIPVMRIGRGQIRAPVAVAAAEPDLKRAAAQPRR